MRCLYCHNPDTWERGSGEEITAEELFARARRLRKFYSGRGGITITGGEPLLQAEFVGELLAICRREGMHSCIDTSGFVGGPAPRAALRQADLVLLDFKCALPARHVALTGQPLDPVMETAAFLEENGIPFWARHVVVPGWTDDDEQLQAMGALLAQFHMLKRVELLPFHQLGRFKWESLGLEYKLADVPPAGPEHMARAREAFFQWGLPLGRDGEVA
jgi:pyruvate formate lyase activating enzyme